MKSVELRKLELDSLRKKIKELEEKYFSVVCSFSMGTSSNNSLLKNNKRLIARAKTILNEKLAKDSGKQK